MRQTLHLLNTASMNTMRSASNGAERLEGISSGQAPSLLRSRLEAAIGRAVALLPSQGPSTAFAFVNSLQGLEHLGFDEGLRYGARLLGCPLYLSEEACRQKLAEGRIETSDLESVLRDELEDRADAPLPPGGTRLGLRLAMLNTPLCSGPAAELRWFVAETESLRKIRSDAPPAARQRILNETRHWILLELRDGGPPGERSPTNSTERSRRLVADLLAKYGDPAAAAWNEKTWEAFSMQTLWRVCREGMHGLESTVSAPPLPVRHRDLLLDLTGEDSDLLVNEVLIRFSAAFADQGFARWPLPERDGGFLRSFCSLHLAVGRSAAWMRPLNPELESLRTSSVDPLESIRRSLDLLGVEETDWTDFLSATLLALRGWAGILWQMETRSDRFAVAAPPGTLVEYLAVRLLLERGALAHLAEQSLGTRGDLRRLRDVLRARLPRPVASGLEQRAFVLFQLAQALGWSAPALHRLTKAEWRTLLAEVEAFPGLERRRTFQHAFERHFRNQALDAFAEAASSDSQRSAQSPRFQAVFCLDARECSFRRHLEEVAPDTETFGTAGFFGVAMHYRGAGEAHFTPLCPIVVEPRHWVVEDVVFPYERAHLRRAQARRVLGAATQQIHIDSRSLAKGTLLAAAFGILATIPLAARVLFPRLASGFRRTIGKLVAPPVMTRLRLERTASEPGPKPDQIGFSVDEMAEIAEQALQSIGLTDRFARLVLLFGHGSSSLNNPHKSAYDCGACAGSAGGPNARALAAMLNDSRVRGLLARQNLRIPDATVFVGGLHNTCEDSLTFFDLDLLPQSHYADFESARATLDEVCQRNAHERCRRFRSAPLDYSFAEAHDHVQHRSEDLAQPRPEYGNASNAICFVGRRERTRGLFLDRRAFLQSYDPEQDDSALTILGEILGAVVPVCSGINLQYFFSAVDSSGWGAGNKLPHNVTALLGVMDGAASDLRSGLPMQGVEIHEPMRLLFIVEATPEGIVRIMDRNPVVGQILRNGWAQLAVMPPGSSEILVFQDGDFSPFRGRDKSSDLPRAKSSTDWYRGHREHLPFAVIQP